MAIIGNPVENAAVASLARPGGNITGSSFFSDVQVQYLGVRSPDELDATLALAKAQSNGLVVSAEQVDHCGRLPETLGLTIPPPLLARADQVIE